MITLGLSMESRKENNEISNLDLSLSTMDNYEILKNIIADLAHVGTKPIALIDT